MASATFIVITGVAGSGKTTLGKLLAKDLGWQFHEGDDFHPAVNVEKMRRGEALTDGDRQPWLDALRAVIQSAVENGENGILACSALKQIYREHLRVNEQVVSSLGGDFGVDRAPPGTAQRPLHEPISATEAVRHTGAPANRAPSGRFTPAPQYWSN